VVVVNTCAFVADARTEAFDAIAAACRLKTTGPCRAVIVTGCLPQRYAGALRARLPEVDAFLGVDQLDSIAVVARRLLAGGTERLPAVSPHPHRLFAPPAGGGVVFSSGPFAYVKIAEGCNHGCAFCAVPGIRGRHRSRTVASIVAEAENLLGRGFRELNLISQDVTAYGSDRRGGADLPALLRALGRIGGKFWLRLLYGYPARVTERLLDAMGAVPQVCHYLDVPIQHSHPDVLRAMRRAETVRSVHTLTARIRAALPDAAVRTTCLLGFPGETEDQVRHLCEFVRAAQFDHLGAFTYSREEGTAAFDLPGRVSPVEAEERRARVLETQRGVVRARLRALKDAETELLLERRDARGAGGIGRSARFAPEVDGCIRVTGVPDGAQPGAFLRVRYGAARGYDITAQVV
jgi:ribosomal protein S12 methylthiotransferase